MSDLPVLRALSRILIAPHLPKYKPNPCVDLSTRGVEDKVENKLSKVKGNGDLCVICTERSEFQIEPRFQNLLADLRPDLAKGNGHLACDTCWRMLDGLVALEGRVKALQNQISNGLIVLKTLVRLSQQNGAGVNVGPRSKVKTATKTKTGRKSAVKTKKLVQAQGDDILNPQLALEEEEDESPLNVDRNIGNVEFGKDPLELDVKEEPLDYVAFSEDLDFFENNEESFEQGMDLSKPPQGFDLQNDPEFTVEDSCRRGGMRKSKIKANQTLSKIVQDEDTESQADFDEEPEESVPPPIKRRRFALPPKKRRIQITSLLKRKRMSKAEMATPAICTICNITFPSHSNLTVHRSRLHDPHTCTICLMEFKCRKSWTDHIRAKHEGVRRHPCPHSPCVKSFYKRSARDEHAPTCLHNPNPTEYPKKKKALKPRNRLCHLCGAAFRHPSTLRYHVLEAHNVLQQKLLAKVAAEPEHCCPTCSKRFWTAAQLTAHLERHKSINERLLCDLCPEGDDGLKIAFKTLGDKQEHIRRVHEGRLTYPCGICPKRFVKPYYLKIHIEEQHKAKEGMEARQICDKCGVSFSGKRTLERHQKYYSAKKMDCTKGVHKRPRVLGKLVGSKPSETYVYKTTTRSRGLDPEVLQGAVDVMTQNSRKDSGRDDKGVSEGQELAINNLEGQETELRQGDDFLVTKPVLDEVML